MKNWLRDWFESGPRTAILSVCIVFVIIVSIAIDIVGWVLTTTLLFIIGVIATIVSAVAVYLERAGYL